MGWGKGSNPETLPIPTSHHVTKYIHQKPRCGSHSWEERLPYPTRSVFLFLTTQLFGKLLRGPTRMGWFGVLWSHFLKLFHQKGAKPTCVSPRKCRNPCTARDTFCIHLALLFGPMSFLEENLMKHTLRDQVPSGDRESKRPKFIFVTVNYVQCSGVKHCTPSMNPLLFLTHRGECEGPGRLLHWPLPTQQVARGPGLGGQPVNACYWTNACKTHQQNEQEKRLGSFQKRTPKKGKKEEGLPSRDKNVFYI